MYGMHAFLVLRGFTFLRDWSFETLFSFFFLSCKCCIGWMDGSVYSLLLGLRVYDEENVL
jgi:hypothetical protein